MPPAAKGKKGAVVSPRLPFDNSYARLPERFFARVEPARFPAPRLIKLNDQLAEVLRLDVDWLKGEEGVTFLSGQTIVEGSQPVAMAYAGHQFGNFVPQLGDGRAILLGELLDRDGKRFDIQLKGAGRTPFSRGGDGRAALGPVLREYIVSEFMAAIGIPTTRSLAALATGERINRDRVLPGAVLVRVASSHIRVGTFQYFAARGDTEALKALADHVIARHYPEAADSDRPYLALLQGVIAAQAGLIARWLLVGFIHGVMNTDNVAISGETIDYGPCAFMDRFAANTVFSSIDANGRYAYGRQSQIMHWNMARFAEALLPAIYSVDAADIETAKALVAEVPGRFAAVWHARLRRKLGLNEAQDGDVALFDALFAELERHQVDFALFFRGLAMMLRGDGSELEAQLPDAEAMVPWIADWWARLARETDAPLNRADAMDAVNPLYIPRNHLVEAALGAADAGDLTAWFELLEVVRNPYARRPEWALFEGPAPAEFGPYKTFCGT
jgi:uncharacterized protein YdiU (UPF0061 family)